MVSYSGSPMTSTPPRPPPPRQFSASQKEDYKWWIQTTLPSSFRTIQPLPSTPLQVVAADYKSTKHEVKNYVEERR